jgi:pantetheine-phosphate adenylyltransferase
VRIVESLTLADKLPLVATGGTFDEIHVGHLALLARAFDEGNKVIIGVSSDDFAAKRGKKLNHSFEQRVRTLRNVIKKEFGNVMFEIAKLDGDFGPAVSSGNVAALIASKETEGKGKMLNEMRAHRELKPVRIITVDLVKAEDGSPISSTRMRAGEIDGRGRLLTRKGRLARK